MKTIAPCALLLAIVGFNHKQGLALGGVCFLAVLAWWLTTSKRFTIAWLIATAAVLSIAAILLFPHHPSVHGIYRAQGWLNSWYGFNLLSLDGPAAFRAAEIIGPVGALNVIAGLWLVVLRNHLVGWLTLIPVLALLSPCIALPIAHFLASQSDDGAGILVFHRLLFAIPPGLALVTALSLDYSRLPIWLSWIRPCWSRFGLTPFQRRAAPFLLTGAMVAVLVCGGIGLSEAASYRSWHSLAMFPADLQLRDVFSAPIASATTPAAEPVIFAGPQASQALETIYPDRARIPLRAPSRFSLLEPRYVAAWARTGQHEIASLSGSLDVIVSNHDSNWVKFAARLTETPGRTYRLDFTTKGTPWTLMDDPGQILTVSDACTIGNWSGEPGHLFVDQLIRIDPRKRYRVSITIKQENKIRSSNFLSIAWYDNNRQLLYSNVAAPEGAGRPPGWVNGSYSYFGVVNDSVSTNWTRYSTTFGYGEGAIIPGNALYMRLGAILNIHAIPGATLLLKNVTWEELPAHTETLAFLPTPFQAITPISLAAYLSKHWDPQRVHRERAGTQEIRRAIVVPGDKPSLTSESL